jgi:hypothetical protein
MKQSSHTQQHTSLEEATRKLLSHCRENQWAGYDPYDALNSRMLSVLPVLDTKVSRLILTQTLKRSPINIRSLLAIPKTENPKALALFLQAFLALPPEILIDREDLIQYMIGRLAALRSPGEHYSCWGYSFPWQTRTVVVPRGTANLVCTAFVAGALLDAYEKGYRSHCLEMAISAAEYVVNELYWRDEEACGFSYPLPGVRSEVHNANLLASALLCRMYKLLNRKKFLDAALNVARYSAGQQLANGAWFYGNAPTQHWIDNFHTGYNLCSLRTIGQYSDTDEFELRLRDGFDFYRNHFFRQDGAPRYFHDRTYPIDTHCVAQSIITMIELQSFNTGNTVLANKIFQWTMKHMWSEHGYFYYRVLRTLTIRTSYIRWSQAWMLLALAKLLVANREQTLQEKDFSNHTLVPTERV